MVGGDYAISIVAVYRLAGDRLSIEAIPNSGGMSPVGASDEDHLLDAQYAYSWYNNFTRDVFM